MAILVQVIGGIGVFLLGMVIMTEGLKTLAGARLSRYLVQATRSPLSGALTGTTSTAILQSSSATTVAAVGFVSAGLLSFSQSLGIIFGANLGTTITGWMVALLGFKLQLGQLLLPLIFIGIMLRLFAHGSLRYAGFALAGFGLVFVGIDVLQQAASQIELIRPDSLPSDSFSGRLQLVALGIVATVVTQSSSAGVAVTLVAVNAGLISFPQAAALVIGMDVGTTITAVMATIGGSVGSRRTGFSHVIYNCFTAIGAFILITPFVLVWEQWAGAAIESNAEIALVAFHSSFNLLGVVVVLPFTRQFAALMQRVIPDTQPAYAHILDPNLLKEPAVALMAAEKIIHTEFLTLMIDIDLILEQAESTMRTDLAELQKVLNATHDYLDRIEIQNPERSEWHKLVALIHAIDHMQRLHERCDEDLDRALIASRQIELESVESILDLAIDRVVHFIDSRQWQQAVKLANRTFDQIAALEQPQRDQIYLEVARGDMDVADATRYAEALRWLTRVSRHIARICFYLDQAQH